MTLCIKVFMGRVPLLTESTLFWDQGLPCCSTCGSDLHSIFHYQRLLRALWHPKCWSLAMTDVSLDRETVTFALFMCLALGMVIENINIFSPCPWQYTIPADHQWHNYVRRDNSFFVLIAKPLLTINRNVIFKESFIVLVKTISLFSSLLQS